MKQGTAELLVLGHKVAEVYGHVLSVLKLIKFSYYML